MSVFAESSSQRQVGTAWRPWHRTRSPLSSFPFWWNNSRVRLALGVIYLTHIPLCSFHTLRMQLLESLVALGRERGQSWDSALLGSTPKAEKTNREVSLPSWFLSSPQAIWGHHCHTLHEEASNWFLALEDVNKPTYKADRELSQAKREAAGLGSVLLGEMRNSRDPTSSETWVNVRLRTYLRKTFIRPPHFILCF